MAAILTVQGELLCKTDKSTGTGCTFRCWRGWPYSALRRRWSGCPPAAGNRRAALPLKDSGGHVALYTADGIGPLATYDDLYTRLLPESDVLALQQGVFVADEAELQRRLEDYGL